jgi:hypothetical protein
MHTYTSVLDRHVLAHVAPHHTHTHTHTQRERERERGRERERDLTCMPHKKRMLFLSRYQRWPGVGHFILQIQEAVVYGSVCQGSLGWVLTDCICATKT